MFVVIFPCQCYWHSAKQYSHPVIFLWEVKSSVFVNGFYRDTTGECAAYCNSSYVIVVSHRKVWLKLLAYSFLNFKTYPVYIKNASMWECLKPTILNLKLKQATFCATVTIAYSLCIFLTLCTFKCTMNKSIEHNCIIPVHFIFLSSTEEQKMTLCMSKRCHLMAYRSK